MNIDLKGLPEATQKVLDAAAAAVGTTRDFLWPVLVRQSYTTAVQSTLMAVVSIVIAWKLSPRALNPDPYDGYGSSHFMFGIVVVAATISAIEFTYDAIGRFINPRYYALSLLLDELRGHQED